MSVEKEKIDNITNLENRSAERNIHNKSLIDYFKDTVFINKLQDNYRERLMEIFFSGIIGTLFL